MPEGEPAPPVVQPGQAAVSAGASVGAAEQFRLALDAAGMGAWDYDLTTGQVFWDDRCREMFGFAPGTPVMDREAIARIHEQDRPRVIDALEQAISGVRNGEYHVEFRVCCPTGIVNWIASHGRVFFDGDGPSRRAARFIGVNSNITGQRQAVEDLRQAKDAYRLLVEHQSDMVARMTRDGRRLYVNEKFLAAVGKTAAEVIGTDYAPEIHADDVERVAREWQRTFEPPDYRSEIQARTLTTLGWRWLSWHNAAVLDENGEPATAICVGRDITQLKEAEQALAGAMQRLTAHMDNSPLAVIEFDPQFRVTRWSKEAERMFGWSAGEILGRAISEIRWVHEADAENVARVSADMLERRRSRIVSVNRNYRKDGSIIECEWHNSAIYDPTGGLASILSQVLDVTERKRTEEQLRHAHKMESIGLLAGGIAHDFNNLLTGIMGNASLALEDLSPASEGRLRDVIANAERAASLTRQLLAYAGKGQFIEQDVDVSKAVHDMGDLVQFSIPKSVEFAIHVQRRLPLVRMDPSQLQQILMNLVINAGEAIGDGNQGRITVSTSMEELTAPLLDAVGSQIDPGRYVCIAVRDTGRGIGPDKRASIFDPFFTTKFTGRGLGLAAVSGIVRQHKGGILVESAPGEGSSFRVLLPVSRAGERPDYGSRPSRERPTVLIVDDEAAVRDFISAVLRRNGYGVLLAADGREALAVCERASEPIGAAILDIVMPLMGANELMPALRARRPEMKILLTSGYSESEARRLCAAYPDASFIQKPYTAKQIAKALKDLLARSG